MRDPLARFRRRARGPVVALTVLAALVVVVLVVRPAAQAAPDVAALDAYCAQARVDWDVPGLAVAIVKDGRVVLSRGYGVRELGGNDAVDDRTLFAIASNTKAFTSAAIAIHHLPWFQLYDPYVTSDTRIRDLLSHRTGFTAYGGDLYGNATVSLEDGRLVLRLEPNPALDHFLFP